MAPGITRLSARTLPTSSTDDLERTAWDLAEGTTPPPTLTRRASSREKTSEID